MKIEKAYFEKLTEDACAYEAEHLRKLWQGQQTADTIKKFENQRTAAEFALALIPQLPPEIVPLLRFEGTNKCWLGDTNIELVCVGSSVKPLFQRYTLQLNIPEHFDDYRLALARLAGIRAEHKQHQQGIIGGKAVA